MGIWSRLYEWVLRGAKHRHAQGWLATLAVAESSFFPIPVDVMLAPMVLARPQSWWRLAALTTVCSVLGGVIGFALGSLLFDALAPWLQSLGYWAAYETASRWFEDWGFWAVFVAGFTPIPFKVFTIAAGAAGMNLLAFVLASLVGRGARFFLVALLVRWGGPKIEPHLKQYIDQIGWICVVLLGIGLALYSWAY